ncbi:MAG: class I adenylate-forming enzyme family protein [Microcella sp.]|uniref:class I adenylate-forming enzyme family protein n=1 Tax=Microcella sp. TaxID=1913979 RepID=UPI0033148791
MFSPLQRLTQHADERPDDPALIAAEGTMTFAELDRAVSAVAARLRALGVAPRQVVATDLAPADDWIVTLALLRIATRTVSLTAVGSVPGFVPDAVLARPGSDAVEAPLVQTVDRLWIEQVVAEHDENAETARASTVLYPRSDSICRLILTSGTTGTPRPAELTVGAVEHRLANLHHYWTDHRRELNLMTLSTTGGFHTALACLMHGTPYLTVDPGGDRHFARAASARVQVLTGSPVQVGHAMVVLRERGIELQGLEEVRTAGAAASPTLLGEIARTLAVPVRGVYGSTEGGGVCTRMLHRGGEPDDVGEPVPGIRLEIVDETGQPVPAGETGDVRYRGPALASGYSGADPDRRFRDGWFHPGDRGRLTAEGHLVLAGRTSELVNVGGVKIDPASVDRAIEGFPGLKDGGSFLIERLPGVPELGLAVVADASCDLRALDRLLRQRLPGKHPTVFGHVSVIPRNRMGKVERGRLTEEFRRRLELE